MITPLSLEQVYEQLLAAQRVLNPRLLRPITNRLALLILSRPVSSVLLGNEEVMVMEFFGLFWVLELDSSITGFFNNEEEAVKYVQLKIEG
jgi:hypothetical protein